MIRKHVKLYIFILLISVLFILAIPAVSFAAVLSDTGWDVPIGTWNPATRTAALTQDYNSTITVTADNVTLDGDGHTLTGSGSGDGLYFSGRTGVAVKNINITGFGYGIRYSGSSNVSLLSNQIYGCGNGIYQSASSLSTLTGNTMYNNTYHLQIGSNSSSLSDPIHYNNDIDTSNTVNGKPVYYWRNVSNQEINSSSNAGMVYLINCTNITVKDLTISNSGKGIYLYGSNNCLIKNNTVSDSGPLGIGLNNSSLNTVRENTVTNALNGINISETSENNIISLNTVFDSRQVGLQIEKDASNNQIFLNGFNNNPIQARILSGVGNTFNEAAPTGGNYWSEFSSPDANNDGFVDSPYVFNGGQDNLPLTTDPTAISPITTLSTTPLSSDGSQEWFKSTPTIILASDKPGTTNYSWTSANGPWTTYTGSFQASEGSKILYYYSVDTLGHSETVRSQTIKVDTVSPTVPVLSGYSVSGTQIQLSWPASIDITSGLSNYLVFDAESDSEIASVQTGSYFHNNLSMGQSYSYYIKAVDQAGNISAQSNTVTVATPQEISAPINSGTNVEVNAGGGAKFIFDQVTGGDISVVVNSSEHQQPSGFRLVRGSTYDITTTSTYSGSIRITLPYNSSDIVGLESNLKLFHWKNNGWEDITQSVDTVNKTITGITTSFSPFAVGETAGTSGSPAVGGVAHLPKIFVR